MKQSHKTLLLWLLLIAMMVVIWGLVGGEASPRVVAFSDFMRDVRAGQVQSVDIEPRGEGSAEYAYVRVVGERREACEAIGILSDDVGRELLDHNVTVNYIPADQNEFLSSFLTGWLPMLFMLGFFFFFIRQVQASGGKAMSFGKSRARLLTESQNKVTFADVAGIDEAKDDCEEIIAFLKDPKKFQRLGGRIPKGVLLMGPPGTGKTLLARAIAGEAGVPFFSISGSDFVEMFVGVGASRVRDLFEQGKKHAPCIIFIDEIDAVGRHRGSGMGGGHDEREQTLNQLLVEMDGFEASEGVIIIAATNRPDVLDPAILRPGRFDRRIVVPRPDLVGRVGILSVHTRKVPTENVDLEIIARGTPGFSGADLENLVNEAALLAARQDKDFVGMQDFEMAKDKVMMGSERRSMVISDKEKRTTAWHEAGHTLIGLLVSNHDPVHKVSIIPRGQALGVTLSLPKEDRLSASRDWMVDRIAMSLGGRIAEELKFGQVTSGAANDLQQVTRFARAMVTDYGMSEKLGPLSYSERDDSPFMMGGSFRGKEYSEDTARAIDDEVRRIVREQYERATNLMKEHLDKLDSLAEALLDRETIDAEDIAAVMEGRELPPPKRVIIPRYSEKAAKAKEKRKTSIFAPRPREVPQGG